MVAERAARRGAGARPLFLGIDVGTGGVRASAVDSAGEPVAAAAQPMPAPDLVDGRPQQDPMVWWQATGRCLARLGDSLRAAGGSLGAVRALAVDGTSGTMLLAGRDLAPVTPGLMYNSAGFDAEAAVIAGHAPPASIARGANSALARLLFLQRLDRDGAARHLLHQAEWITCRLLGRGGLGDENNVLKLGYDLDRRAWPAWFAGCGVRLDLLPRVHPAGAPLGRIDPAVAGSLGLAADVVVAAATTDSNAAFLAAGAGATGDAVTSLGTTLALKLLSDVAVADPARGVYSHRVGGRWLAGGASNTGGGVLAAHFGTAELAALSARIDPAQPTGLDYYPLLRPGERFPVNDPAFPPRLEPRPADRAQFLQAMLEGIARVEALGYRALADLGAPYPTSVRTAGGGARNPAWTAIRAGALGVPVIAADHADAAVGAARLARRALAEGSGALAP